MLPLLSPGIYRLRVSRTGYQLQEVHEVELPVAARLEANFALRLLTEIWRNESEVELDAGGSSAIVSYYAADVEQYRMAAVRLVPSRTVSRAATLSYVVDTSVIAALPLNGRDVYSLLALQPGVTSDNSTGRGLGLAINGMRPTSSNFLLDGLENNNYLISGPLAAIAPEATMEYRVSVNNFSAEYGRAAGYIANALTRAGPGQWHGAGYFNLKNTSLNANEFQANRRGIARRPLHEKQNGFWAGGPLRQQRLFVSGAWESLRSRSRLEPSAITVLSPAASAFVAVGSPADQLMKRFPTPATGRGDGFVTQITVEQPVTLDRTLGMARLDYLTATGAVRLGGRLSLARPSQPDFIWSPYPGFNSELRQPSAALALNAVSRLSARWMSETRFGWSRDDLSWNRPFPEIPTMAIANEFQQVALPGSPASYEYRNLGQNWEWNQNLLLAGAGHTFRLGGGLLQRRLQGHMTVGRDSFYAFDDIFSFLRPGRADSGALLYTGVERAALPLLKSPDYERKYGYRQVHAYVEDTFRIAPGLTLNPGIRYENFGAPSTHGSPAEAFVQLGPGAQIDERLAKATLTVSGLGNQPLYRTGNRNFAVRMGFAYTPGRSAATVLRGAYGVFYDRPFDNLWQNHRNNSVALMAAYVSPLPSQYLAVSDVVRRSESDSSRLDFPSPILFDPNFNTGFAQQYFLGVERRVGGGLTVSVNGAGALGRHLITTDAVNRAGASTSELGIVTYRAGYGKSNYTALSTMARWGSSGRAIQASYTWSHSIDNQSDPIAGDFFDLAFTSLGRRAEARQARSAFSRESDWNADRGNSDFDQRHNLVFWANATTPTLFSSGPARIVFRDWSAGLVGAIRSGFPFTVFAPSRARIINQRANVIGPSAGSFPQVPVTGGLRLLQKADFGEPAAAVLGNSGRNAFAGPGLYSLDLSLSREFRWRRLGEGGRLVVRADAYNLFNHANLGPPDSLIASPQFGIAQYGRRGTPADFPVLSPFDETARRIQLILRLHF